MITDAEMVQLVERAHAIMMKGFARTMQFPEHVAVASPVFAVVLASLIAQHPDERREAVRRDEAALGDDYNNR